MAIALFIEYIVHGDSYAHRIRLPMEGYLLVMRSLGGENLGPTLSVNPDLQPSTYLVPRFPDF